MKTIRIRGLVPEIVVSGWTVKINGEIDISVDYEEDEQEDALVVCGPMEVPPQIDDAPPATPTRPVAPPVIADPPRKPGRAEMAAEVRKLEATRSMDDVAKLRAQAGIALDAKITGFTHSDVLERYLAALTSGTASSASAGAETASDGASTSSGVEVAPEVMTLALVPDPTPPVMSADSEWDIT